MEKSTWQNHENKEHRATERTDEDYDRRTKLAKKGEKKPSRATPTPSRSTRQANLHYMLRDHPVTGAPDLGPRDPLTILGPLLDAFDVLSWKVEDLEKWFPSPGRTNSEGVIRWPFAGTHDKPQATHHADERWLFLHGTSKLELVLEEGTFNHCLTWDEDGNEESAASHGMYGIGTSLSMNTDDNEITARQVGLRMTRHKKNVLGFAFEAYWVGPKVSIASGEAEHDARRKNDRCVTKLGSYIGKRGF
jgi:hypothetical protein